MGKKLGIIDQKCDASKICQQAAKMASKICRDHAGASPPFQVETYKAGQVGPRKSADHFSYIPGFLRYMILELLKNCCSATVKNVPDIKDVRDRPIRILVCTDDHKVAIRISDQA